VNREQFEFFRKNAFVNLGRIINDAELTTLQKAYDEDQKEYAHNWRLLGNFEARCSCDILISHPSFDEVVRHPRIMPLLQQLVGDDVCFEEISLREIGAFNGTPYQSFHRDNKHWDEHPLRIEYLQLLIYLTDVAPQTHCFSISPESASEPVLDNDSQLKDRGVVDLHGPAGTCVLFNTAALHSATIRKSKEARKSIQIYYGHSQRKSLSDYSSVPAAFWRDHAEPEVRRFYGKLNKRTRMFADAYALCSRPPTTGRLPS
jgi:hypothetical protein